MTARNPLYWNGTDLQEMSSAMVSSIQSRCVYLYGGSPSVTVSQVASGGNISPTMTDTRKQAGAYGTRVDRFPTEAETAEPGTVTVNYDRISQTVASISTPTDTNSKLYPAFYDGSGSIQAMSATDVFDTFITQAIGTLTDGNDRDGTYRIHTSTSLASHTLVSATPVFTDTRANTGAYTAGGIPETQDQPTTISNFYLMKTNQGSAPSITIPVQINGDNDLQEYSSANFDAMLLAEIRHHTANTTGSRIRYNVDGSGSNRGSGMTNTILNGSGNYQQRFVNANDYRAQEFPNGSAVTANTYRLKIQRT
jgi:hypothetical protein